MSATVRIPLHGRGGIIHAYVTVDAVDAEWLLKNRWTMTSAKSTHRYAARRGNPKLGESSLILMHREIMGLPRKSDGRTVDHIDGDTLNNTRSNLRVVTHAQNQQNQRSVSRSKRSKYRGVIAASAPGRWIAQAKLNGKHHYLGTYDSEEAAAAAASAWRSANMPYSQETVTFPLVERRRPPASSQYRGVIYFRWGKTPRWIARVYANGRTVNVGSFSTELEAAIAYDQKARVLLGERAVLNFPDEDGRGARWHG